MSYYFPSVTVAIPMVGRQYKANMEKSDYGMIRSDNILYLVIPCYNEEEVLNETAKRLFDKVKQLTADYKISSESRILFVNDGSKDSTWDIITELYESNKIFQGLSLSKNCGHQNALLAGLNEAKKYADVIISMDADLQDDVNAVDEMIECYHRGIDIVYGVRRERKEDTWFKRNTALGFYKLLKLMGADTVYNHADYRLMSKRSVEGLSKFKEVNLFLRGIIPMIGYPSDFVYYERGRRFAGISKYPLRKMLSFAVEGLTSLSVRPLRLITLLGAVVFLASLFMLVYSFTRHFMGQTIVGWTTLMVSIWAIGGLILFSIGVVGEYIGKIYLETKERPRYFVDKRLCDGVESE